MLACSTKTIFSKRKKVSFSFSDLNDAKNLSGASQEAGGFSSPKTISSTSSFSSLLASVAKKTQATPVIFARPKLGGNPNLTPPFL